MKRLAFALCAALAACGCSSFLHFADPGAQAVSCSLAESELVILEGASGICGPFAPACLTALEAIFGAACTNAAAAGKSEADAHKAGMDAASDRAGAMRASLERAGVSAR